MIAFYYDRDLTGSTVFQSDSIYRMTLLTESSGREEEEYLWVPH